MSDGDSIEDEDEDDGGDMDAEEDEDDDYEQNNGVVVIETGAGTIHRINPNMDPDYAAERDQEDTGLLDSSAQIPRSVNLSDQFLDEQDFFRHQNSNRERLGWWPINRDPLDGPQIFRNEHEWTRRTRQLRITDSHGRSSDDSHLTHPLLQNQSGSNPRYTESQQGLGETNLDWVRSIENIIGAGSANILGEILSRVAVTSRVSGGDGTSLRLLDVNASRRLQMPGPGSMQQEISRMFGRSQTPPTPSKPDPLALIEKFTPLSSGLRWANELDILYGTTDVQRALNIAYILQNALVPQSIEIEKAREEEEARKREQSIAERETLLATKRKERQEATAQKVTQTNEAMDTEPSSSRTKSGDEPRESTAQISRNRKSICFSTVS